MNRNVIRASAVALSSILWLCGNIVAQADPIIKQAQPQVLHRSVIVERTTRPVTQVAIPVESLAEQTMYSPISDKVYAAASPRLAVMSPLDTLKANIFNRLNSGLLTGKLTDEEGDEIRAMIDPLAVQEAEFKLSDNILTAAEVSNLQRKYNLIGQAIQDRASNSNTVDYLPTSPERRRNAIQRTVLQNVAAGNLTPVEGEQLLTALNVIEDNQATFQATGGTLSATELEQLHRDMFRLEKKFKDRTSGIIAVVRPDIVVHRQTLLKRILDAIASNQVSKIEGQELIHKYNQLAILESEVVAAEGIDSVRLARLNEQVKAIDFALERQLQDRQIAGSVSKEYH